VVSAETVRRWLHELGWEWKRAKLLATDDDPQRVEKLARIRYAFEPLRAGTALLFADELASSLLPQVGYQWMPTGAQGEVMTPGTKEKRYVAGALDLTTATTRQCVWYRNTTGLFVDLLATLDRASPASAFSRLSVLVDNSKSHYAGEVEKWLAAHPRFALLSLPTYCPKANPIERACGDIHDKCTRNHTRKRMWHLVQDGEPHLPVNGPWPYALSALYYTPEVTAAVEALRAGETAPEEIAQLAA
jgi:DDE superfamily endonuclease